MRVIIAGSRGIGDPSMIDLAVFRSGFEVTEVVEGEAPGVDIMAREWAKRARIPCKPFPADWKNLDAPGAIVAKNKYGAYNARAGFDRNEKMAEYGEALIAIWDGVSPGTADMIKRAQAHNLPIFIYRANN